MTTETTKKTERKISVNYTLERFANVLKSLNKAKMLKEDEKKQLVEIYNKIYEREKGGKLEL